MLGVEQEQDHSIRTGSAEGGHIDGTGGDTQARKLEDRGQARDAGSKCDEHDHRAGHPRRTCCCST